MLHDGVCISLFGSAGFHLLDCPTDVSTIPTPSRRAPARACGSSAFLRIVSFHHTFLTVPDDEKRPEFPSVKQSFGIKDPVHTHHAHKNVYTCHIGSHVTTQKTDRRESSDISESCCNPSELHRNFARLSSRYEGEVLSRRLSSCQPPRCINATKQHTF